MFTGTETVLMEPREYDRSSEGFDEWPLMAVHFWGEKPEGTWRFRVYDKVRAWSSLKIKLYKAA